jgi:WD40 repeat protein
MLLICANGWIGIWYGESQSLRQCDLCVPSVQSTNPVTTLIRTRGYKHLTVGVVESYRPGASEWKSHVRVVDLGESFGPTGGGGGSTFAFFRKSPKKTVTPDDPNEKLVPAHEVESFPLKMMKGKITDLEFEPHSDDLSFIVSDDAGDVHYVSRHTGKFAIAQSYDNTPGGVSGLAWLQRTGGFMTISTAKGVAMIWTVSNHTALAYIRMHSGPIAVRAIPTPQDAHERVLLALEDGSVGVADVDTRKVEWVCTSGHRTTIFDLLFDPRDPDRLIAASGSAVNLWRCDSMQIERRVPVDPGTDFGNGMAVIHGLAVCNSEPLFAGVTTRGEVYVWRLPNCELLWKQQVHTSGCNRCAFHNTAPVLACNGDDLKVTLLSAHTGAPVCELVHESKPFGIAFSTHNADRIVTGTASGNLYVWYVRLSDLRTGMSAPAAELLLTLSGHAERVFNVVFHPLIPGVIASGSDDRSIRVWTAGSEVSAQASGSGAFELNGHAGPVRALVWHKELARVLFSGDWEAEIRVWDVPTCTCLQVTHDHTSDVYAIASHPSRPFLLASAGRDASLRLWSAENLAAPVILGTLAAPQTLPQYRCEATQAFSLDAAFPLTHFLSGEASEQLAAHASKYTTDVWQAYVTFFIHRANLADLWPIVGLLVAERNPGADTIGIVKSTGNSVVQHGAAVLADASTRSEQDPEPRRRR